MAEKDRLVKVILVVRDSLASAVEGLNEILREIEPSAFREPGRVPNIDLADLDAASWTSYQTKGPAEPGTAAWIKNPAYFTSFEAPECVLELIKALARTKNKRLKLGDMEYFFSGEEKFLSRRPAKKEGAK